MLFRIHHRPIIPLLLAFMSGILTGGWVPGEAIIWLVALAATIRLLFLWRLEKPALVVPLVLFFSLGYLAVSPFIIPVFPPGPVRPVLDEKPRLLSGAIVDSPVKDAFRTKCLLKDLKIQENGKGDAVFLPGRLQLHLYGTVPVMHTGDLVKITAGIRPLKNFNNPGGFDYRQFMAYGKVWGSVYGNGRAISVKPGVTDRFARSISDFRESVDRVIASASTGDSRAILSALVIGKKDRISPALQDAFSRSGASHLLAISGLHVGILASCAFFLFKWLLGRSAYVLRSAWINKWAAAATLIPVIGYGLISGMSPSTQRAVIMVTVFLAAFMWEREYDSVNTLAAGALAILIVSPPALFNISFQLSFAAVAAILFGLHLFPVNKSREENLPGRMRKTIISFIRISLFAIIGTTPLVMHYFNQVCLIGIASNLVLIPLLGFLAVPAGLISTIACFFYEPIALEGFALADMVVRAGLFFVHHAAAVPLASFRTVTPSILEITCIYTLLISILILWKRLRPKENIKETGSFPYRISVFILVAGILLAGDTAYWIHRRFLHKDLRVTILDVGQGNAALLELPGGRNMMIDAGGFNDNSIFDVGALIVAPFLWENKIRTIDTVVLTHPDADHLNGLLYILEHFRVGRVISTHIPAGTDEYKRFSGIIHGKKILHPEFATLASREETDGVVFEILYPPKERKRSGMTDTANNQSIVLKVIFQGIAMLFPGDVEAPAETEVVNTMGTAVTADILLSPHHGSRTSSTPAFLDCVDPDAVIISTRKSRYGLPSPEVIQRYENRGFLIFQTDKDGAIRVLIDRNGARIKPFVGEEKEIPGKQKSPVRMPL